MSGQYIKAGTIEADRLSVSAVGEITKGFVTESSFEVRIGEIIQRVSESSEGNLIANSSGSGGVIYPWKYNTNQFNSVLNTAQIPSQNSFQIVTNVQNERYAYSNRFKMLPNSKYTFTCYYSIHGNSKGLDIYLLTSNNSTLNISTTPLVNEEYDDIAMYVRRETETAYMSYEKITYTLTTGAYVKSAYLRIDANGSNTEGVS